MNDKNVEISIVLVQASDYSEWLSRWLNYQQFYGVTLSEETTASTWARFFDTDQPLYCAVAKQGQSLIGFVHYVFHPSTWSVDDFCYLEDLFVDKRSRGKNIGKQLIEYVKQQAAESQCGRLYWHTQEKNITAQRLYDWVAEKPGVIEYRLPL